MDAVAIDGRDTTLPIAALEQFPVGIRQRQPRPALLLAGSLFAVLVSRAFLQRSSLALALVAIIVVTISVLALVQLLPSGPSNVLPAVLVASAVFAYALSSFTATSPGPFLVVSAVLVAMLLRRSTTTSQLSQLWITSVRGNALRAGVVGAILLSVVSAIALSMWFEHAGRPFLGFPSSLSLPSHGAGLLVIVVCCVNAVAEELVFRVSLPILLGAAGTGYRAICVLACSFAFGLAHVHGVPGGWTGVLMTVAFGLAAWWLTHRSGSITFAIAAHTAADLWIAFTIVTLR